MPQLDPSIHDQFIKDYAKLFDVPADPYSLAVALINTKQNYQTATAFIFGLSWSAHKDWLVAASIHLKESWDVKVHGPVTADWLGEFVTYYLAEKANYPEGA